MDSRSTGDKEDIAKGREAAINRTVHVVFGEKSLEESYDLLCDGKFEDKRLHSNIAHAIEDLKKNNHGIKVPKKLWPKMYIQKFGITNLWKYDLPNGWRLIYTIKTDDVMILNVILEWFNHKDYEKRFKY